MTFAEVGSFLQQQASSVSSTTISLNNQAVGDLILLEVATNSSTVYATSVSGGGVTWSQMGTVLHGSVNAWSAIVYAGKVTATGAGSATITLNGTANIRAAGWEFSSTVGSWALDVQGNLDSAGTNAWPSLTPAGAGEIYFGYAHNDGTASSGVTANYTYTEDNIGNGALYNAACTSAVQAPTWGDSTQALGVMVLVKEVSGSGGNVSGVDATLTFTGEPGTPAGAANVTGVDATVTFTAEPGTPSGAANVTGVSASVTFTGEAGTPGGAANVSGVAATVVFTAEPGTPSGSSNIPGNVSGAAASLSFTAEPGSLTAGANITGAAATLVFRANPGIPGAAGPLVEALLNGTVKLHIYTGTVSPRPFTGTVKNGAPVVPIQADITGNLVNNDVYADFQIFYQGAPLNLTGYTIKVVLKATRYVADASGVTFTNGSGVTVTSVSNGQFTLDIPHADLASSGTMWYRVDLIDGASEVFSAMYGNFQVLAA